MIELITTTNILGEEIVSIVNEDGSAFSMLKSEYDKINSDK